jgi:predicted nucleic acid-binding protein
MLDTNIVIYLLDPESAWFDWASDVAAAPRGDTMVSAIVLAELAAKIAGRAELMALLESLGVGVEDFDAAAAVRAGAAHSAYRAAGGTREKLLGDFMIGAHAVTRKVPLATRDPRPYRRYFPDLKLITPETDNG